MVALPLLAALLAGIAWTNDIKAAQTRAAAEARPLLLQFRDPLCEADRDPGGTAVGRAGGRPPHGSIIRGDILSPCAKMEEDVWGHPDTAVAASRFVAVLVPEGAARDVHRRYEVATLPTALVTDPWGNEIVRMINYVEREQFIRILNAIPANFEPAQAAGAALARDPDDVKARFALGRFYETRGLREIAERYYENALGRSGAREPRTRRDITVARASNLLRLGRASTSAKLFEQELQAWPDAPDDDVVLLGLVLAQHHERRTKEARAALEQMKKRFPASPYTARATQALEAQPAR